jgi:dimethylglycine dehydrogenase
MTLTGFAPDRYWLISAAAGERHDEHWLREHLPAGGSVRIENLSARYGTLIVVGPKSRELLSQLTSADLSNAAFPVAVDAQRGDRLHACHRAARQLHGRARLGAAHSGRTPAVGVRPVVGGGRSFGIRDFGLYAMDSLRLEKCYRAWKGDLTTEYTPFMASLDRFVKLDKPGGFIGQEALRREAATGPRERFVPLIVEAGDADAAAVSIVYRGAEVVGLVTSGGYGYRLGKSIALAYVRTDLAVAGTELEVEILGERKRARVAREPLYDPENALLRS